MYSPDAFAQDIANTVAGATWDELRAREEAVRRDLDTWLTSYRAALASERHHAPPPLTVKEACSILKVSRTKLYELIRTDRIAKVQDLDSIVRIPRSEIDRFIQGDVR